VNLLLLQDADRKGSDASVSGRRAHHIKSVLKKTCGDSLIAGIENQGYCLATIVAISDTTVDLKLGEITPASRPLVHVVLAVPRPKALSRIVSAAASFGAQSLTLIGAWRVEKSYFDSPRLTTQRLRDDAVLGAEQGKQVWVPRISVVQGFRRYVEDVDPVQFGSFPVDRIALHPGASVTLDAALPNQERHRETVLALGPEGGFISSELESWQQAGYALACLQTGPLKTEVALAAALGQIALLRPPLSSHFLSSLAPEGQ